MKKVFLLRADAGDWIGIYVDGKLVNEGHSLSESAVLEAVEVDFDGAIVDFDKLNWGRCPETLEEVKRDLP